MPTISFFPVFATVFNEFAVSFAKASQSYIDGSEQIEDVCIYNLFPRIYRNITYYFSNIMTLPVGSMASWYIFGNYRGFTYGNLSYITILCCNNAISNSVLSHDNGLSIFCFGINTWFAHFHTNKITCNYHRLFNWISSKFHSISQKN